MGILSGLKKEYKKSQQIRRASSKAAFLERKKQAIGLAREKERIKRKLLAERYKRKLQAREEQRKLARSFFGLYGSKVRKNLNKKGTKIKKGLKRKKPKKLKRKPTRKVEYYYY